MKFHQKKIQNILKWKNVRTYAALFVMLLFSASLFAQLRTVSGIVKDSKGDPLIGVAVQIKGNATAGAVTDVNGKFLINAPTNATLIFSYIGYVTLSTQASQSTLNVEMVEDTKKLDEIVVVGYGTQRKSDLTGSVSSVKSGDLAKVAASNPADALQGKAPGVQVLSVGSPGTAPIVRIRGIGTNGNPNPLYVVDGMMVDDIQFLNTSDIESMEILKDASATAIYGSRGANGVIMVTTKKGKTGKPIISLSVGAGTQYLTHQYQACNAGEYAQVLNMIASNNGSSLPYSNPSSLGTGTNWMKECSQNGIMQDYQASITGGTEAVHYNVSGSYFSQDGLYKFTNYNRLTLRANNDYQISKHIKIGHNLSFSNSNSNTTAASNYLLLRSIYGMSPLVKPINDDGSWGIPQDMQYINPYAALRLGKDANTNTLRFVGNGWLNYEILNGLLFRTSYGVDYSHSYSTAISPSYSINPTLQTQAYDTYNESYSTASTWLWENTLNYDKKFGNHHLTLLAGVTAQKSITHALGAYGQNYVVYDKNFMTLLTAGTAGLSSSSTANPTTLAKSSYLFRTNYSYKDKYLLTASLRSDGSSIFGTNNRWAYFPSGAIGWRASQEDLLKNVSWISNLKLRASYGQTGNDKITSNVAYALITQNPTYYALFNGKYYTSGSTVKASNPDIKWERNEQYDCGLDFSTLNNRLTFEFDWFTRDTKDLLVVLPISGALGSTGGGDDGSGDLAGTVGVLPTYSNAGTIRNRGIEFTIGWQDKIGDFNYGIRLTGSTYKNKVLKYTGAGKRSVTTPFSLTAQTCIQEGEPLSYFYGYKTIGIYHTQADIAQWNAYAVSKGKSAYDSNAKVGDLIFADTDGDGAITTSDQTKIGSPYPDFTAGLGINLGYKGFDFSVDLFGNFGGQLVNTFYANYSTNTNYNRDWLNSWTTTNTGASLPRLATGTISFSRFSNLMVESGTYVKIRNVEFGYSLPQNIINKLNIQKIRIYLSATNPLCLTKYKGFSPEVASSDITTQGIDYQTYPVSGSAKIGLNVTF